MNKVHIMAYEKKQLKKHDNNNFLMKNMHICRYSQVEGGRWCNVAYLPYMHPIITCKKGGGREEIQYIFFMPFVLFSLRLITKCLNFSLYTSLF